MNPFENWKRYKVARNRHTDEIRKSKRVFECKTAGESKNNPKPFYKYVNSNLRVKEGVGNLCIEGGGLAISDKQKCNVLSSYFNSVFNDHHYTEFPDLSAVNGEGQYLNDFIIKKTKL